MDKELQNALAWFTSAPNRLIDSGMKDLEGTAEWIWTVLQGDFAEEQSTAQVVTGTIISMIPLVDQICDIRDICANAKKINQDDANPWAWLALVITLIGLFPTLGSLFKGLFKVLFAGARKYLHKLTAVTANKGLSIYPLLEPYIERGIIEFNKFIARPEVKRAIKAMNISNIYKEMAKKLRELKSGLSVGALLKPFDEKITDLKKLLEYVNRWGGSAMQTKALELIKLVMAVRNKANKRLAEFLSPVQDLLERTARRLDIEADVNFRATVNAQNFTRLNKPSAAAELTAIKNNKPNWVDVTRKRPPHPEEETFTPVRGFPNLEPIVKAGERHPLDGAFKTFEKGRAKAVTIKEGEVLYRVIDPTSADNSICWMRKAEFDKLKSKDDWRRKFAVWANWNSNGEYVTYTVPKGGLNVWEGAAATQIHKNDPLLRLEGGAIQIVLDPTTLQKGYLGKRQPTNWGYASGLVGDAEPNLVGVPKLTNNWR